MATKTGSRSLAPLFTNFTDVLPERKCEHQGGAIPAFVRGTLLRNGPGTFAHGETAYAHWFDGDAFVQRFAFRDGEMFYSARSLETDAYLRNRRANRIVAGSFGTRAFPDPCKTIFERFFSYFQAEVPGDNANVSFQDMGDQVYALTEIPMLVPVSPDTLDVGTSIYAGPSLFSVHTSTAHPHSDAAGNVYNIGSRYGKDSEYIIAKMAPKRGVSTTDGAVPFAAELIASIPVSKEGPAYYHSFGMSEHYFVLVESPLKLDIMTLAMRRIRGTTFKDAMRWKDDTKTEVVVVDRRTGTKIETRFFMEPCFTFHHANTFERDGHLVVDIARYRKVSELDDLLIENIKKPSFFEDKGPDFTPYLHRLIVPLCVSDDAKAGDDLLEGLPWAGKSEAKLQGDGSILLTSERLSEFPLEFPRYNYEACNAKKYRYVYGTTLLSSDTERHGVVKIDCDEKTSSVWYVDNFEQLTGEPVFVADPHGNDEDDGVILVPVMTISMEQRPYVAVLNARDCSEIARFVIPEDRIPFGFHSHYTEKHSDVGKKKQIHF